MNTIPNEQETRKYASIIGFHPSEMGVYGTTERVAGYMVATLTFGDDVLECWHGVYGVYGEIATNDAD
jgi:hypothetical protein